MTPDEVLFIAANAVQLIFSLSMPIILVATIVGLIVALLQTVIQLQGPVGPKLRFWPTQRTDSERAIT